MLVSFTGHTFNDRARVSRDTFHVPLHAILRQREGCSPNCWQHHFLEVLKLGINILGDDKPFLYIETQK